MRVLMITPYFHPVLGGVETVVENLSTRLNEIGIPTDIMTFNFAAGYPYNAAWRRTKESIKGRADVIRVPALNILPNRLHSPLVTSRINLIPMRFRALLQNYDIMHFHNDVDLSFPLFSLNVRKYKVFHCHVLDVTYDSYRRNPITRFVLRNAACIYITLSKLFADYLVTLGISESKIRILPNGIDTDKFRPSDQPKDRNLLLFVGRLEQKKGLPVLLESLKHLQKNVRLAIVGPTMNMKYFRDIEDVIQKINRKTAHEVTYLGALDENEKLKWYQKASVFLCPSVSESFPMVNIEALSCGTPVVASDVGAISEVVRDHENGILVPPRRPDKLAEAIQYLLDNEKERRMYGSRGREWILQQFSSEVVVEKLLKIYKELPRVMK